MKQTPVQLTRNRGLGATMQLQIIEGNGKRARVVLNQAVKESLANRFQNFNASLATLAWENGWSQHRICECIVEIARAEGIRVGVNKGRFERSLGLAA